MSSNFWFRIASLGLASALVFSAGCGNDDDNAAPPAGPDAPDPVPNTALSAFADVVNAIEAEYYLDADGDPVVVGEDTTSIDNVLLVHAAGSTSDDVAGADVDYLSSWFYVLVDTTRQVTEAGFSGPAKYVASVDRYGEVTLAREPWRADSADEVNGGVILPIMNWDVDSEDALNQVWADSLSNASLAVARLDSILSADSYVARRDTLYDRSPLVYGVSPVGFVQRLEAGTENDRYHVDVDLESGPVSSTDYAIGHSLDAHASHLLHKVDPTAAGADSAAVEAFKEIVQDFTVIFWADSTDDRSGLFKPGEAIQGYHGQEIWTGKASGGQVQLYFHYPPVGGDDAQNVEWVKVASDLVTGAVAASEEPAYAPDLAAADQVLVIILSSATGYDPATVWYLDRPDANVEYALTSEPTSVENPATDFNEYLEYWIIEEIWVEKADIAPTDGGIGYGLDDLMFSVDYELAYFRGSDLGMEGADSGEFFPRWLVNVHFLDPSSNEILETIDYVEVSTDS